ncbi:MAG TPA: 6-phosphogluconolactonase [Thermomicrobiales bacterium]|nr:6-phosphogluconolactonase [Thermomicrobiales bacterium]
MTTTRKLDYAERGAVIVVADAAALAQCGAELVATTMQEAVAARGIATIALSGGSTPKAMGALFLSEPYRSTIPWEAMRIFWGDERRVPLDDPESNAGEAMRGYLDHLPIPKSNIHPFPTAGDPDAAAAIYAETVSSMVPGAPVPLFDLILLGMGDDGHTASLFPFTSALMKADELVVANPVEKLHTTRLTFTERLINAGRTVAFLAGGAGKKERLHEVLDGALERDRLPSQRIRPTSGNLIWIVDEAAAASLNRNGIE